MRSEAIDIEVDGDAIAGTLSTPATALPGVLFVHGRGGSQDRDLERAPSIAALGCVCLTFDMRGHAETAKLHRTVTRQANLDDLAAAYDRLAAHPQVDKSAVAVVGSSYGGYLACLLTTLREVRWLALRAPALYCDDDWDTPKFSLNRERLAAYRRKVVDSADNRALAACARFEGDVLIVESEHDDAVPHPTIANYVAAFRKARSLTSRQLTGADHGLSDAEHRQAYTALLRSWATEMVTGAR